MEVMLPTAVGGAAALFGAVTYGLLQPAGRRGGSRGGRWLSPPQSDRIDLAAFAPADLSAGLARASSPAFRMAKRFFDIMLASLLLLASAPLLAVVAILVPLESAGPVFYRQERVGAGGRVFRIVKFRSMRQDAEAGGARWAAVNDDRVTRIGRLIRHFRIDEIPQAFNVLAGDMSFVGPRPERPEFVGLLREAIPHYDLRHSVKPGITGWAQVKHQYGASIEDAVEKHRFDLFYLKNNGPLMDLGIVLLTVRVALFGLGAR
ncbi:MAG: hypothetical protein GC152_14375 [Alphaproteobacteria bacterium]|nr:hypothetical protein [Alphaproteobacteria bacterium]